MDKEAFGDFLLSFSSAIIIMYTSLRLTIQYYNICHQYYLYTKHSLLQIRRMFTRADKNKDGKIIQQEEGDSKYWWIYSGLERFPLG